MMKNIKYMKSRLREEFPDRVIASYSVMPSPKVSHSDDDECDDDQDDYDHNVDDDDADADDIDDINDNVDDDADDNIDDDNDGGDDENITRIANVVQCCS